MGTGPFEESTEQEAALLLRQLSDYTTTIVRQEIHRAQVEGEEALPDPPNLQMAAGGLLGVLGVALLALATGLIVSAARSGEASLDVNPLLSGPD